MKGVVHVANAGAPGTLNGYVTAVPEPPAHPDDHHHGFLASLRTDKGLALLGSVLALFSSGLTLTNTVVQVNRPAAPSESAVVLVRESRARDIDEDDTPGLDPAELGLEPGTPELELDHETLRLLHDAMTQALHESPEDEFTELAESVGVSHTGDRHDTIRQLLEPIAQHARSLESP